MRRSLSLLLAFMLLISCMFAVPACAEIVRKGGVEVELTTDKENYDSLDEINAKLTVTNTNSFDMKNVSMEIQAPNGYVLTGEGEAKVATLAAGKAQEQRIGMRDKSANVPNLPKTGDDSHIMLWGMLFVLSVAALCMLAKNPQAKRMLSLLLCIALIAPHIAEAAPALAMENTVNQITVEKDVSVAGKTMTLTGTVTYEANKQASRAAAETSVSELYYKTGSNGVMITAYTGTSGDLVIPAYIDGKPVTMIGDGNHCLLSNPGKLETLVLPDTVEEIAADAFAGCINLKSIDFPDGSLRTIGFSAFVGCDSLEEISIYSADGLTIGQQNSTGSSGGAFANCDNLKSIDITSDGDLFITGEQNFAFCINLEEAKLSAEKELYIGKKTFENLQMLTDVTLEAEEKARIDEEAFSSSALNRVTLPNAPTTLENGAFQNCQSLEEITILPNVTSIHKYTFTMCGFGVGGLTIKGYAGSYVESFVKENNSKYEEGDKGFYINFIPIEEVCDHSSDNHESKKDPKSVTRYRLNPEDESRHAEGHQTGDLYIRYCLDCGSVEATDILIWSPNLESHMFESNVCVRCGYGRECEHTEYTDTYNPQIPILYTDMQDGMTHTYQNGFDRVCNACGVNMGQVYGEATVAEHDYTNGDVCICGYDRSACPHDPDHDASEYKNHIYKEIVEDNVNHTVVGIVYTRTCSLCKKVYEQLVTTGTDSNGMAFPYQEAHNQWDNGVCVRCGYACSHPEKNAEGESNYLDEYTSTVSITDNKDGLSHLHTYNVKRTCLHCGYVWVEKLENILEEHSIRDLDEKGVYKYDSEEHWMEVPRGCSCGYLNGDTIIKYKEIHDYVKKTNRIYVSEGAWHTIWDEVWYECECGSVVTQQGNDYIGSEPHRDQNRDNKCDYCLAFVRLSSDDDLDDDWEAVNEAVNNMFILDVPEGFDRMLMQGFGGSLYDAFEDLENVSEGGLYNGQDIVQTMAMIEIQSWLTDLDSFSTKPVKLMNKVMGAFEKAGNKTEVGKILKEALDKAKKNNNYSRFLNDLSDEMIRNIESIGFANVEEFFKFAQIVDGAKLVVDGTINIFDGFSRVLEREQAKAFASIIIHNLTEMRDSVESYRLRNEIDIYIQSLNEDTLAKTIQTWFNIDSLADNGKFVVDTAGFMADLMEQGWFGDNAAKMVRYVNNSQAYKIVGGGIKAATLVTDTPGLVVSFAGYNSDEIVKCAISMNTIVQVFNEEREAFNQSKRPQERIQKYRNLVLMMRAWYQKCKEYVNSATGWDVDIKKKIKEWGLAEFEDDEILNCIEEIDKQIEALNAISGASDEEILRMISR